MIILQVENFVGTRIPPLPLATWEMATAMDIYSDTCDCANYGEPDKSEHVTVQRCVISKAATPGAACNCFLDGDNKGKKCRGHIGRCKDR